MDVKKITRHELIGLKAKITDAKNKANIGIQGKIIDETKNTISIEGKKILKKNVEIEFTINNKKIKIDGEKLQKNPIDRTKSR